MVFYKTTFWVFIIDFVSVLKCRIAYFIVEKFDAVLDKIGQFCESEKRSTDGDKSRLELFKFLEERAYPGRGKVKHKRKSPLVPLSWASNIASLLLRYCQKSHNLRKC